jgi:hypothetical protein
MKIRQILLACATVMALTTSPVWADRDNNHNRGDKVDKVDTGDRGDKAGDGHFKAPEIDAASGTSAIALLTGVLLLAGERARSKRSTKMDV